MNPIATYTHWLHTKWPAGKPERLPVADEDGRTNVKGLYIVGDLTGVPLLKLSANAGVRAVRQIAEELKGESQQDGVLDVAIIGGGTSGFAAATECEELGLSYCVFEASKPFATIKDFPKAKPIYTYPTDTDIEGRLVLHEKSEVKEGLVEDLEEQTVDAGLKWVVGNVTHVSKSGRHFEIHVDEGRKAGRHEGAKGEESDSDPSCLRAFVPSCLSAKRVIVGIGRSGNYRTLGVPGEDMTEKVTHRLHDPADYCGKNVLVVGGGDSALETAIALVDAGADVTLSYRKPEFNRPKPENQERIDELGNRLTLLMNSDVTEIRGDEVDVELEGGETNTLKNEQVFLMIGREAPLRFFRKSGVHIRGEKTLWWWTSLLLFLAFCVWLYHWKAGKGLLGLETLTPDNWPWWLVWNPGETYASLTGLLPDAFRNYFNADDTLGGVILNSMGGRSFYYTLAYSLCVVIFGIDRIKRRKTPYVKVQTYTLTAIQVIPLFLLPEIILPYMGATGWFDGGPMGWLADQLFPGQSYWRAYGLVLAWPLMAWNWFTAEPIWAWLILGFVQTFVLIPAIVYYWGKGAYCGWICSCGALAETLGDRHREKMPHGPFWNRFNMVGQAILLFAFVIQALFILRWMGVPYADSATEWLANKAPVVSWAWFVDLFWAGILGVGLYFWFSGRVWCRFACPLAALMHIYHRFGQFAILADKKKCISCNVCTTVCHQGIDVMSFANKGKPMKDPQCVRCSACVQMCPTGVLSFGRVDGEDRVLGVDGLMASPVRMKEVQLTVNGKKP